MSIKGKNNQIGVPALQPSHTFLPGRGQGYIWSHYCQCCGNLYFAKRQTGTKYCSAKCRKRASRGTSTKWRRYCQQCGKLYTVKQPGQWHSYCSDACRQKAYRQRKKDL